MASIRKASKKKRATPVTPKTESPKQKADRLADEAARKAYVPSPPSKSFVGSLEDAIDKAISEGGERLAQASYGWMGDGQVQGTLQDEPFVIALKAVRATRQNNFDNINL